MNRDRLRPVIVALLAVVAIAVAGATLDSAVAPGSPDRDPGLGGEVAENEPWTPFDLADSTETGGSEGGRVHSMMGLCFGFLQRPIVVLGALALVGVASIPVYRRAGGLGVLSVFLVVLPFGTLVYAFLTQCDPRPTGRSLPALPFLGNQTNVTAGNATGTGGSGVPGTDPPIVLLLVVALVVVALVVVLVRTTGDHDPPSEEVEDRTEDDEVVLADVGHAAGDAADRIESGPSFENEVYRAWREMTSHLDVAHPRTSTPGEFARAATEAGMEPAHVAALTDLFREVRYGGAEPTAEREERAIDALRRIEAEYGTEGRG